MNVLVHKCLGPDCPGRYLRLPFGYLRVTRLSAKTGAGACFGRWVWAKHWRAIRGTL